MITTVAHNVGDDFVRDGIIHLLGQALGPIKVACIHKHLPVTARKEMSWFASPYFKAGVDACPGVSAERLSNLVDRLPLIPISDRILQADLVVQSGAPVYWVNATSNCATNEWYQPLIARRWEKVKGRVPLLNIGAGTCQGYFSNGDEFESEPTVLRYVREFFEKCRLTTIRDRLSARVLELAGVEAIILPCPSLFARDLNGLENRGAKYVALNYMPGGGHFELGSSFDPAEWERTFVSFARELVRTERCVLVCHDRRELHAARILLPELEVFYSQDHREYMKVYSQASFGVVNRVHAAFALASFGRNALVVGNDSRARMAEMIGLQCMFVGDATSTALRDACARLRQEQPDFEESVLAQREMWRRQYIEVLGRALRSP